MKIFNGLVLLVVATLLTSGALRLNSLFNYANQEIPDYITQDNTPASNPITDEGATLGRVLFYDKALSSNNTVSCASCHKQEFAFGDNESFSQGVNNKTFRHSMRLINIRFGEDSLFRWDRAAKTLEDQMTIPIKNHEEMGYSGTNGDPDFDDLIAELESISYYDELFTDAFGDATITEERIQKSLAQFVRSIQSFDSKYDEGRAMVSSDLVDFPNFNAEENAGKKLFMDSIKTYTTDIITVNDIITGETEEHYASKRLSGGFDCVACHRPPEFDIAPDTKNNGFTRGNSEYDVFFDYDVVRTPTIRDVIYKDASGPIAGFFHSGTTNINDIADVYDFRQEDERNNNLDERYVLNDLHIWLDMTDEEKDQLNAFMATLTGTDVYTNEKWSDPFDENGTLTIVETYTPLSTDPVRTIELEVYPNPASDRLTIKGDITNKTVQISDLLGQVLASLSPYEDQAELDLQNLKSGVYLVIVQDQSGHVVSSKKLIKR